MKEEITKEFHTLASAEPTQAPAHHRFYHTRLWSIVHGEAAGVQPCENRRGAEENNQTDRPAADGSGQAHTGIVLDEFLVELQTYCGQEKDLLQRMRTLRFTRSCLAAAIHQREHHGAGKKCGHGVPLPHGPRCARL